MSTATAVVRKRPRPVVVAIAVINSARPNHLLLIRKKGDMEWSLPVGTAVLEGSSVRELQLISGLVLPPHMTVRPSQLELDDDDDPTIIESSFRGDIDGVQAGNDIEEIRWLTAEDAQHSVALSKENARIIHMLHAHFRFR